MRSRNSEELINRQSSVLMGGCVAGRRERQRKAFSSTGTTRANTNSLRRSLLVGVIFVLGSGQGEALVLDSALHTLQKRFVQSSVPANTPLQRIISAKRDNRGSFARFLNMQSPKTERGANEATETSRSDRSGKRIGSLADQINQYDPEKVASKIDDGEFDAPTFPRPLLSSAQGLISRIGPVLLLNFVTVLWGSQHAVIKLAVDSNDSGSPAQLNLLRFAIAALIFLPFAPPLPLPSQAAEKNTPAQDDVSKTDTELVDLNFEADVESGLSEASTQAEAGSAGVWMAGGWLGLWTFAGYAMQSVGLQYTSASRSAFILYLNVKFVPIIARVIYGRKISQRTWISAAVALVGTALLGSDGSPPNLGDAWSLGAAVASAFFILSLEAAAREHKSAQLNAVSQLTVALLSGAWVLLLDHPASLWELFPSSQSEALIAVYLGVVTTALTSFLQTVGQQTVKAEKAAIIYAMDPVYAAGFSFFLLQEQLGAQGLVGAALLVAAAVYSRPTPSAKAE